MDISTLGRTAAQPVDVVTRRPQRGAEPVQSTPIETPLARRTEPVSLSQTASPMVFERPLSVQSLYRIEPLQSGSLAWDQSLKQSLPNLAEPGGWTSVSRGLGQLSGTRHFSQRAEALLTPSAEAPKTIEDRTSTPLGTMRFSATLASGQEVTFEVHAEAGHGRTGRSSIAFQALDIHYSTNADLTDDERAELDALSQRLGDFVSHFAASGEPDLSQLRLNDLSHVQSIDLYFHINDQSTLSVQYDRSNRAGNQTLDMRWNGRRLELQIDRNGQLGGGEPGGLGQLRAVLLENLQNASAEKGDTHVILRALTLFDSDWKLDTDLNASTPPLPKGSDTLLTGLPDYRLTFKGAIEHPLRNTEHADKYSGIRNLTLAQTTQTTEQNGVTSITQNQSVDLEAAYFTSLPHLDDPDFARLNFNWHQVNESHQLSTQQVWRDATLLAATLEHSISINNLRETWSEGVLLNEQREQKQDSRTIDLRPLVEAARFNVSGADRDNPENPLSAREAQAELQALLNPMQKGF